MKKVLFGIVSIAAVLAGLLVSQRGASATGANGNHATYTWVIGATTPSDSATAPDGYGPAGPAFPPGFTGGQARLKVTLDTGAKGVLTITCVLGKVPGGKGEGITLVLGEGVSGEFTQSTEGNNIFILS
jgi:hypothetical protein